MTDSKLRMVVIGLNVFAALYNGAVVVFIDTPLWPANLACVMVNTFFAVRVWLDA